MGTGTSSSTVALGNHTHSYAGASSSGGSANSAVKLDSTSVGSASCPVYFSSEGKPVAVTTTAAAASGGTALTVVTTGEKYTWNNKSNLTIGTGATQAAAGNHTHNYAGSSSAGGSANSAVKLSTSRLISVDMSKAASSGTSFDGSAAVDIGVKNQLAVGNGGTGASTLTSKGILYGNGTSAIGATAAGTSGQLLKSQGSSGPTWVSQSDIVAGKASVLQTSRTISLTGAVTGSTTFNGGADASITTSISLATGDTSGHVKIAGTNIKVKNINNAAYKDVTTKPTYGSSTLITSDGVYKRITYRKFVLTVNGWGTDTYEDATFNNTGVYRQTLSAGGEVTADTEIVSVKLLGSLSGTKNSDDIYYDQQFSKIFQVETGASAVEFRASAKPTVQMTVIVGYVIQDLNVVNTQASSHIDANNRFSVQD